MPADRFSRMMSGDEAIGLLDRSPLAVRVFLAMFWGGGSERCGVARAKPGELADDLKSSRRAIVAALVELADSGLIAYSEAEQLAYRPGFALHFRPTVRNNWVAWRNSALAIRDGLIRTQVLEELGSEPEPSSRPSSKPSSLPSSTPKTLETLETLETNKRIQRAQPDHRHSSHVDAVDIAVVNLPTPTPTRGGTVPAAQVSADGFAATESIGDDYFDELFRSQPQLKKQLAGEGTTGKQTAAILHNQLSAAAAVEWNLQMTKLGNPACVVDRDWAKRNARNVAKVIAAVGGLDNLSMLLAFACAEMPYFAGKPYGKLGHVRAWTMAEWCTRATIEHVQAGLNSYVQRDTGKPSVCQLDWTRKPTAELLKREEA